MGKIYFLIGGARSGKSTFAEKLAASLSEKVGYLATAEIIDEEMTKRVEFHKKRRPESWKTFEIGKVNTGPECGEQFFGEIEKIINKTISLGLDVLLVDCITILLFRMLYEYKLDDLEIIDNELEKKIESRTGIFFEKLLTDIKEVTQKQNLNIVIVSNEVGLGIVPPYPFGRVFRDMLGIVNRKIAGISDEVYFFVAGLNIRMK
jgi:adenosylcobinamide kinase/adenosylcobinamide-phosphate guanylyltransferase